MRAALSYLRSFWSRAMLRHVHFADRHDRMDSLYRMQDPWGMTTPRERFRFDETNRLIQRACGRPGSILEIGCGEGHQSEFLARVCDELVGIDVSPRAVSLAKERVPAASFEAATLKDSTLAATRAPFDLVVAAEVLYYVSDAADMLDLMERRGRQCFVTYYDKHRARLDPLLETRSGVAREAFSHEQTTWVACWWPGKAAGVLPAAR